MAFGGWLDWVLAIVLLGVAVLLFMGKGDFVISGTKGQNRKIMEDTYDYPKLVKVTGVMCLLLGLVELLMAIAGESVQILNIAYLPACIIIFVGGVVCINKCKKKKK
jgi:preprotein translocase subunit SecG